MIGLALPALVVGLRGADHNMLIELLWLLAMTVIGFLLLLPVKGMTRLGGVVMIALYGGFVLLHLLWAVV